MVIASSFHPSGKVILAAVAGAFFVVGWLALLVVTPLVVGTLPEDYFANPDRISGANLFDAGLPPLRRLALLARNLAAGFLIFVAPILLQSIFAPFFGLLLAAFRAKPRLIRAFASQPLVWRLLNAIRRRRRQPPFLPPLTHAQETHA